MAEFIVWIKSFVAWQIYVALKRFVFVQCLIIEKLYSIKLTEKTFAITIAMHYDWGIETKNQKTNIIEFNLAVVNKTKKVLS